MLDKFQAFQARRGRVQPDNVHHRLNIIASLDPAWQDNRDYYILELVISLAILSTVGNITIWLVRHLFADPDVLGKVRAEVEQLLVQSDQGAKPVVELSRLRESCHWLVASWYEVLRLHMTGVPRQAINNFELSGGERIKKGDIILLPMSESNRDARLWADPGEFAPGRFIGDDGKVVYSLTRKVKAFGVAGNMCPGRYHAFGVIMAVVTSLLLTFDVNAIDGGWAKPVAGGGISGGFDRCANDVRVELAKKDEWRHRKLPLEFSRDLFRV